MVDLIERFAGASPTVAGKPERPLLDETVRRVGGTQPLMVGDRLDTDIEGAHRAGVDSLLVLTGVTGLEEVVAADPEHRPSYLSVDLAGLFTSHPEPVPERGGWDCGGWRATVSDGRLAVSGQGAPDDWWRAAAAAAWRHLDEAGSPVDVRGVEAPEAPGRSTER
jgi:hypothetical protein